MLNKQGRQTQPGTAGAAAVETISGDRGLDHEEPLLFERGRPEVTGVDFPMRPRIRTSPGRSRAKELDRLARPLRAGSHAPLRAPVAAQRLDRRRISIRSARAR